MTEYLCITSVYHDGLLYEPGERIELPEGLAQTALNSGSIGEILVKQSSIKATQPPAEPPAELKRKAKS